mmetsp:Transcript_16447/g.36996  ORF Transcript_16447/g.36996 Transcript_16447/m.36996 type:complete len:341 (+) Transcript_16447:68-1090(+)
MPTRCRFVLAAAAYVILSSCGPWLPSPCWLQMQSRKRVSAASATIGDALARGIRTGHGSEHLGHTAAEEDSSSRRAALLFSAAAALGCLSLAPRHASAKLSLSEPNAELAQRFDVPRDKIFDARFAQGMYYGMKDYERAVEPQKRKLFEEVLPNLPKKDAVVVEVGIGSFPNAKFYACAGAPESFDLIGVDPNDSMETFARTSATEAGILSTGSSSTLRVKHGVAEALPLEDKVADLVVCSLTLCSVLDPEKALAEIKRVLKPNGKFLFHEHVISETSPTFAQMQRLATPGQMKRADGCRLDRRSGELIKAAGFSEVRADYYELNDFFYLNPTVSGIATA